MEEIRCIGCGAIIQSEDINGSGYVPKEVLATRPLENLLCRRCHRIKYYNEYLKNELPKEEYYKIMQEITARDALFVYVADIFDFEFSINPTVIKMLKGKDVLLVGNKIDLLPKSQKLEKLTAVIQKHSQKLGLKYRALLLLSVKNKQNIDELISLMEKERRGRNVYFLGNTNVGKSSLINALLRSSGMVDMDIITSASIPGTTLDLIEIPFFDDGFLYDSPGLILDESLLSLIDASDYQKVMPKVEIKPGVYQLNSQQALTIGGFASFHYLAGCKNTIITYFSNQLTIRRNKSAKAIELFPARNQELYDIKTLVKDLDYYEFELKEKKDLVIAGLGFITIKHAPCKIGIYLIKGTGVMLREPIIG